MIQTITHSLASAAGGGMTAFSILLLITIGFVIFFLLRNGKLNLFNRIPKFVMRLLIGVIFVLIAFVIDPICFPFGFSIIIISSFLAIKDANAKRKGIAPQTYYPSYWTIVITFHAIFSTGIVALFLILLLDEIEYEFFIVAYISVISLLISSAVVALYFLPYLIANKKCHQQTRAIYILNIFAGWTIIAWVIALIWANTVQSEHIHIHQEKPHSQPEMILQYKALYDSGVITKEEFDAKKQQLLEL